MLNGATLRASEMAGTAVFRIVVSSDSIKNATATNHGKSRLLEADGAEGSEGALMELTGLIGFAWRNHFTNESGNLLALAISLSSDNVSQPEGVRGIQAKFNLSA
jgi:hypothetical protein